MGAVHVHIHRPRQQRFADQREGQRARKANPIDRSDLAGSDTRNIHRLIVQNDLWEGRLLRKIGQ